MKLLTVCTFMVLTIFPEAMAQESRDVPIRRDFKRVERLDRQLDRNGLPAVDPNVTPDNPDGVVGWDGPPFNYGDPGVIDGGPLPPGSPADIDED